MMPADVIYLARHGQTVWNVEGRIQGGLDSPLTAQGREQAQRMGAILAREIGDPSSLSFQTSPLGRTLETAALIAQQLSLAPRPEMRLAEVTLGSWDGFTRDEIEARFPDALSGATRHDWYFRSPDGETFDMAIARAREWLAMIQGPVVAVSHGLFGRLIRGCFLGLGTEEMLGLPATQDGVVRLARGEAVLLT